MELDLRRKIYNYILKNPSSYEREISKKMKIPKTTLRHHLIILEKRELISSKKEKGFTRYFVTNKLGQRDKEILTILKQDVPRNILIYLMYYVVCSQLEISKAIEKKPSTIYYHLKKLIKLEIIVKSDFSDEKNSRNKEKLNVRKKIKGEKVKFNDFVKMAMHRPSSKRFIEIDMLRGLAITLMVFGHILWDLNYFGLAPMNNSIYSLLQLNCSSLIFHNSRYRPNCK